MKQEGTENEGTKTVSIRKLGPAFPVGLCRRVDPCQNHSASFFRLLPHRRSSTFCHTLSALRHKQDLDGC